MHTLGERWEQEGGGEAGTEHPEWSSRGQGRAVPLLCHLLTEGMPSSQG